MARYMGGPRGHRKHSPASRAPLRLTNEEDTVSVVGEDDSFDSENDTAVYEQHDDRGRLSIVQTRPNNPVEDGDHYIRAGAHGDPHEELKAGRSKTDEMNQHVDDITPPRLPGKIRNRQGCSAPSEAPLFPGLSVSSRDIDDSKDEDSISVLTSGHRSRHSRDLAERPGGLAPGIDSEYTKPESSELEKFISEPLSFPIAYGWMVRGTKEHVEDLHLSGIMFCDREVDSKRTIKVLCEYTWIQPTPSQDKTGEIFPAIYVPGNARIWQGLKSGSSLKQGDLCAAISRTIRDENSFLQPQYPYEPTFRALEVANADLSFTDVDIVMDADTLTRLLAFICGPGASGTPTTQPFRLDLCTVHNTLFVVPKEKPGSGHAGPLPKNEGSNGMNTVPTWAAHVLGRKGSEDPRLPYSGGHYRLIRYRFGNVVLAVRVKVDFVYEHHQESARSSSDSLYGATDEVNSAPTAPGGIPKMTTVKAQGLGTNPGAAGMATVRYRFQDRKAKLNEMMPHLWFSRTSFLVEGVVTYPTLEIKDASLINSQQYYKTFERGHRCSLRHLAGLLRHLQTRTRELDGNAVMICDPIQLCFVILKPVVIIKPVPEDIVLKFWGPNDHSVHTSERDMANTSESENYLTDFSKTPAPPQGFNLLDAGETQYRRSHKTETVNTIGGNGCSIEPNHPPVEVIGLVDMAGGWDVNMRGQSVEDDGYEPDVEDNTSDPLSGFHDICTTDDDEIDDDIMMGESVCEPAGEERRRLPSFSRKRSFKDDEREVDDDGTIFGGRYQDGLISEGHNSFRREDSDGDHSGYISNQMRHRLAIDLSHSEEPGVGHTAVDNISKKGVSIEDGTFVVLAQQRERRSTPDKGHSLNLDGATTPGGSHRLLPSSHEEDLTFKDPQRQYQRPLPESRMVGSDTETYGAATPYMD